MASGSIGKSEGQSAREMIPASSNTGHPLAARVQSAPTSGR